MAEQSVTEAITARLRTLTGRAREGGGASGLARRLGMEPANVRRYVRGTVEPPHDFLVRVADAEGVSLDWLYGRDQTPPPPDPTMPMWARRLENRVDFLASKIDSLSAAPRLEVTDELLTEFLRLAEERRSNDVDAGTEEPAADEAPASQDAPTGAGAR